MCSETGKLMKSIHMTQNILLLAILIGLLSVKSLPAGTSETMCDVSDAKCGENATITCHFGVDVGNLKEPVQVIHQLNDNSETPVLTCMWEHNTLSCVVSKNYIFDENINDTLRLQITNVSHAQEGSYACVTMTQTQVDYQLCHFILDNGEHNSTHTFVDKVPPNECFQSNITDKPVCNEETYHYVLPVVIAACIFTVVVIGIFFICFVKRINKIPKTDSIELNVNTSTSTEGLLPEKHGQ